MVHARFNSMARIEALTTEHYSAVSMNTFYADRGQHLIWEMLESYSHGLSVFLKQQ